MVTTDELIAQAFAMMAAKSATILQAYLRGDRPIGLQVHDPAWWRALASLASTIASQIQPTPPPPRDSV